MTTSTPQEQAGAGALADFLSRDPNRIAQRLAEVTDSTDKVIDAHLAANLADIEATIRGVDIDPKVRRGLAKYFWELEKSAQTHQKAVAIAPPIRALQRGMRSSCARSQRRFTPDIQK